MEISLEDVKKLAKLSRLEFTDEEAEKFIGEFSSILDQVDKINKVDVSNIDLYENTINAETELRLDEVLQSQDVGEVVANAPAQEDGAFVVPLTVDKEGGK